MKNNLLNLILALIIISIASCNSYEKTKDGRTFYLERNCVKGHYYKDSDDVIIIDGMEYPWKGASGFICDEHKYDTVFIK